MRFENEKCLPVMVAVTLTFYLQPNQPNENHSLSTINYLLIFVFSFYHFCHLPLNEGKSRNQISSS